MNYNSEMQLLLPISKAMCVCYLSMHWLSVIFKVELDKFRSVHEYAILKKIFVVQSEKTFIYVSQVIINIISEPILINYNEFQLKKIVH